MSDDLEVLGAIVLHARATAARHEAFRLEKRIGKLVNHRTWWPATLLEIRSTLIQRLEQAIRNLSYESSYELGFEMLESVKLVLAVGVEAHWNYDYYRNNPGRERWEEVIEGWRAWSGS